LIILGKKGIWKVDIVAKVVNAIVVSIPLAIDKALVLFLVRLAIIKLNIDNLDIT